MDNTSPRNTSADDALTKFSVAAFGGIEAQEAAGQREMLTATTLPSEILHSTRQDFEALGFEFGPMVSGDDLFIEAELPKGWSRDGSDHAMWSYILDERGIRRVALFYKAAFYDRKAHMSLVNVGADIATKHIYGEASAFEANPALTEDERAAGIRSAEAYVEDAERNPDIYADRLPRAWQVIHGLNPS